MLKTHPKNIAHIKAALKVFPEIWFHGDGNIYHKKKESDDRKDFTNNGNGPETYRIHFKQGDNIPATVEDMNKSLIQSKTSEIAEATKPIMYNAGVATFSVDEDEDETKSDSGNASEGVNLNKYSKEQLSEMLTEKGIEFDPTSKKEVLINLLSGK